MAPSMSDIKFLLVLLRYKTFNINFLWKVFFFWKTHLGFLTLFVKTDLNLFQSHKNHQELWSSHAFMPIDSNLFHARVGVYNFNIWSSGKEPNIHIKGYSNLLLKTSIKILFFMRRVLLLLVVFLILHSFLFLKVHLRV